MKRETIVKLFVYFLKWENAYDLFESTFKKHRTLSMDEYLNAPKLDPSDFIASAFMWPKEDLFLWVDLDDLWKKYCNRYIYG